MLFKDGEHSEQIRPKAEGGGEDLIKSSIDLSRACVRAYCTPVWLPESQAELREGVQSASAQLKLYTA